MRFGRQRSPTCPLLELPPSETHPPSALPFFVEGFVLGEDCKGEPFLGSVPEARAKLWEQQIIAERAAASSKQNVVPAIILDQSALQESGRPTADLSKTADSRSSADRNAIATDAPRAANLGRGVLWQHCPDIMEGCDLASKANRDLRRLTIQASARPSASQLGAALLEPDRTPYSSIVSLGAEPVDNSWVLVPEVMQALDCCSWRGDGHYDMSPYSGQHPPSLGQVVSFLKLVDAAVIKSGEVLCLSSHAKLAHCAVLAGAVLVLARGFSAEVAWQELLRTCPSKLADPRKAWDRFPPPFSQKARTTSSSLSVLDCLAGLEFARDEGWVGDYQSFNVSEWEMLRRRLDASWVIPGKVLAMANPYGSAQNPKFPGLLEPGIKQPEHMRLGNPVQDARFHNESKLSAARGLRILPIDTADAPALPKRSSSTPNMLSLPEPSSTVSSLPGIESFTLDPLVSPVTTSSSNFTASSESRLFSKDKDYMETAAADASFQTFSFRITARVDKEEESQSAAQMLQVPQSLTAVREDDTFTTYLQRTSVRTVIRVNGNSECPKQSEHEQAFSELGIQTKIRAFEDGDTPTMSVLKDCLAIFGASDKTAANSVAVHCMGGLGRTACVVGAYAVSCFKIQGPAFHGWCRICRPGTVQTPKQEAFIRSLRPKTERLTRSSSPVPMSSRGREIATRVQNCAESLTGSKMWI